MLCWLTFYYFVFLVKENTYFFSLFASANLLNDNYCHYIEKFLSAEGHLLKDNYSCMLLDNFCCTSVCLFCCIKRRGAFSCCADKACSEYFLRIFPLHHAFFVAQIRVSCELYKVKKFQVSILAMPFTDSESVLFFLSHLYLFQLSGKVENIRQICRPNDGSRKQKHNKYECYPICIMYIKLHTRCFWYICIQILHVIL